MARGLSTLVDLLGGYVAEPPVRAFGLSWLLLLGPPYRASECDLPRRGAGACFGAPARLLPNACAAVRDKVGILRE